MGSLFKPVILFTFTTILFLSYIPSNASDDQIFNNFMQCLRNSSAVSNTIFSTILTAQNSSFEATLKERIWNAVYAKPETPKPSAIILAKEEPHIRATILCAKKAELEIRVRSGGHDVEAISSASRSQTPFAILDMLNFRTIEIDGESAWVGAGATMGELYYKIAEASKVLAFPASICPGVCAGGHISGGGYGNLMRKYGLASDNVVDAKIMCVDGSVHNRKTMGEDVFWALRGGGGASFGVILAFKVNLVKVPEKVTVFNIKRSREQGVLEAIDRWQYISPSLPNKVFIRAEVGVVNNSIDIGFVGEFLGSEKELVSLLGKEFPELGLKTEECHEMSWVDSTVFWDNHPIGTPKEVLLNRLNGSNFSVKIKSDYIKKPIPKQGLKSIWKLMVKLGKGATMKWNPYGGKMGEISESESPFPHRKGNLFLIQYSVVWTETGNEFENKNLDKARELYEKMTPFVTEKPREAFFNYRDCDLGMMNQSDQIVSAAVYMMKYFNGNFNRLMMAKNAIDPENFFRNEQSIPGALIGE